MANYEYSCLNCNIVFPLRRPIAEYKLTAPCPQCNVECGRVVSIPGYRRDHTVFDTTDPDKIFKVPS